MNRKKKTREKRSEPMIRSRMSASSSVSIVASLRRRLDGDHGRND
jgi:hypothetical protein